MNIIVTGGAGFIGSNFIYYMLKKHPAGRIICVDKLTYAGNLETLEAAMEKKNFKFIRADIADRQAVYRIFEQEKPDIVVNFAAESHVDRSIENPEIFLQTNVILNVSFHDKLVDVDCGNVLTVTYQLDITKATYVTHTSCTIKCMEYSRKGRKRVSARLDNFTHYIDLNSTDAAQSQTDVRSGVIRIIKTIIYLV